MAFGQQQGPPASSRQVQALLALLRDAGHADFRDARGPMGFTQRQAAGKFTTEEAAAFIDQLEEAEHAASTAESTGDAGLEPTVMVDEQTLRQITTERLAAELQRRGWIVVEP